MRDYSLFALCALALAACSSTELVPGTAQVKVVSEAPPACEFLGEVEGQYQGGSMASGTLLDKQEAARLNLKEQTAALAADTVKVTKNSGEYLVGDAYRCEKRVPASK
jgi:hypothetical protein